MSDLTALVKKAQKGDSRAMSLLIESLQEDLYRFCLYLTGNPARAQDLMQDAFIKVLGNIKKLSEPSKFKPWLFHSTKNLHLDYLKSPKAREMPTEDMTKIDGQTPAAAEAWVTVRQALAQLDHDEQFLILMIDLEEHTYAEVAEVLKITEEAVTTRLFKARQALKNILKK